MHSVDPFARLLLTPELLYWRLHGTSGTMAAIRTTNCGNGSTGYRVILTSSAVFSSTRFRA